MAVRIPVARWVAAVLATAAAGLAVSVAPAAPASADTCSSSTGVSVVVDFGSLGGGVQSTCVASGGGERASSLFPDAGFPLDYVQSQPGFVCRVSSAPASDPCVNTPPGDAYWGLWWSDGTSGDWSYSNYGVGSLKVPDGGYVAFAWQGSSRRAPGISAAAHAAAPSSSAASTPSVRPSATPTHKSSQQPTHQPAPTRHPTATSSVSSTSSSTSRATPSLPASSAATNVATSSAASTSTGTSSPSTAASDSASSAPAATTSAAASAPASASAGATPSDSMSPAAAVTSDPATGGGSALPGWVIILVLVVLLGVAAVTGLVRRSRRSAS